MVSKKVKFTEMKDGDKEDYLLLKELEKSYISMTSDRIIEELKRQGTISLEGYQITRLEHGLQSGTRAFRDGADIDWIIGALLHDIGDGLAPQNHDKFSAEVIRPFVRWEVTWTVAHHGIFQMIYYAHHYGWDKDARDRYKDHPCFDMCSKFCERWDQKSFDPNYPSKTIEYFEPMVEEVFSRKAFSPEVIRENEAIGFD